MVDAEGNFETSVEIDIQKEAWVADFPHRLPSVNRRLRLAPVRIVIEVDPVAGPLVEKIVEIAPKVKVLDSVMKYCIDVVQIARLDPDPLETLQASAVFEETQRLEEQVVEPVRPLTVLRIV